MASVFTPSALVTGVLLSGGATTLYIVPVLTSVKLSQLTVMNVDTLPHNVTVWLAPNNSAGLNQYQIWKGSLAPGQSFSVYQAIDQVLGPGSTIQASADLDSVVSLRASGVLIQ